MLLFPWNVHLCTVCSPVILMAIKNIYGHNTLKNVFNKQTQQQYYCNLPPMVWYLNKFIADFQSNRNL